LFPAECFFVFLTPFTFQPARSPPLQTPSPYGLTTPNLFSGKTQGALVFPAFPPLFFDSNPSPPVLQPLPVGDSAILASSFFDFSLILLRFCCFFFVRVFPLFPLRTDFSLGTERSAERGFGLFPFASSVDGSVSFSLFYFFGRLFDKFPSCFCLLSLLSAFVSSLSGRDFFFTLLFFRLYPYLLGCPKGPSS